jgi:hypothetical protein
VVRLEAQFSAHHFPLPDPELTPEQLVAALARSEEKIANEVTAMLCRARAKSMLSEEAI